MLERAMLTICQHLAIEAELHAYGVAPSGGSFGFDFEPRFAPSLYSVIQLPDSELFASSFRQRTCKRPRLDIRETRRDAAALKRQRTGAVHDVAEFPKAPSFRGASWSAVVLYRFGRATTQERESLGQTGRRFLIQKAALAGPWKIADSCPVAVYLRYA